MVVSESNLSDVIQTLSNANVLALDTETHGLAWEDRLFSIIISNATNDYYFNYHDYGEGVTLPLESIQNLSVLFNDPTKVWVGHNFKFDLHMLSKEGLYIAGKTYCTQAHARVIVNTYMSYSLHNCAKRIGMAKDDKVMEYLKSERLYEYHKIPGKDAKERKYFFSRVPYNIIVPYGEQDGRVTYDLAQHQIAFKRDNPEIAKVWDMETALTKVCFEMENTGIMVDRKYTLNALMHEKTLKNAAQQEFLNLVGIPFKEGKTCLEQAFAVMGYDYSMTPKGNPCFNKDALDEMDNPLANIIKKIRFHNKYENTYYSSFLHLGDDEGVIRPSMNQAGTETGRFSYSTPNLQNVPKEEDLTEGFCVRKCFVPRDEYCFVMIDYNQMEYRMLMDYAGEHKIIEQINAGVDVHQVTGDMMNVNRSTAKTLNFMLLYGGGADKLAKMLSISSATAKDLKLSYFEAMPKILKFVNTVQSRAKARGHVFNWLGRRCHLNSHQEAYKIPNHLIQGGCADVVKLSMVKLHEFLKPYKSRMVLCVHDEIVFEVHKEEYHLVDKFKDIMENVYSAQNGIQLTTGVDHSHVSWGSYDKVKGAP